MSAARYVIGDVFDCLAATPDGSVDLILTSPPFLALRSYLPADHPDKGKEIGSEPDPAAFIDTLLALTAEFGRVLAPHGSIAIELGDTYAGGSAEGTDTRSPDSSRFRGWADGDLHGKKGSGWPDAKSLALIPEAYRMGLAYGRNPINGTDSPAGRWRVRNVVRWCRPNPPVGALGDKFRPGTSDMVIACRARDRYFDLDAVRTPHADASVMRSESDAPRRMTSRKAACPDNGESADGAPLSLNPAGAPPLDWWQVSTEAYGGSHYATWPRKLLTRPILAMSPQRVCTTCGQPSRRIVRVDGYTDHNGVLHETGEKWGSGIAEGGGAHSNKPGSRTTTTTLGWTDCGHNTWRNGLILDPFAGSGTTLAVATGHGRDALGFDIDARNAELARERIGDLFLTVETLEHA